jgi:hypothetical protein
MILPSFKWTAEPFEVSGPPLNGIDRRGASRDP